MNITMKKDISSTRLRSTQAFKKNVFFQSRTSNLDSDSENSDSHIDSHGHFLIDVSVKIKSSSAIRRAYFRLPSPKMALTCACIVFFTFLSTAILKRLFSISVTLANKRFLELDKCPACYGVTLCPSFFNDEIVPNSLTAFLTTQLFNSKNVFYAQFKNKQVVLKKLARDDELEQLDHSLMQYSTLLGNQSPTLLGGVSEAIRPFTQQYLHEEYVSDQQGNSTYLSQHLRIFNIASQFDPTEESYLHGSDLLVCPSQRKLDYVEAKFVQNNLGINRLTSLYNLMTILLLNSEPLILQTFSAEEGWPFPHHIGVCGRFFVEEYIGPSLVEWLPRASWKQRVHAAYQMLKIAQKFTIGVNGFRLYPSDLSIYNIAVDQKGNVKIIDAENIIIVDLDQIRQRRPSSFNVPYASDNAGCEDASSDADCVSYSEESLCNRLDNDHNFFVVCHELFSPSDPFGLIQGLPDEVLDKFPQLPRIQKICYSSSKPGAREEAAKELISIYSKIVKPKKKLRI